MEYKSKDIARAAIMLAMSTREEEAVLKENYKKNGIKSAAVDIEMLSSQYQKYLKEPL